MSEETLEKLRKKIDEVDKSLVGLLNKRLEYVKDVGEAKRDSNLRIYHPERENQVLRKIELFNENFPVESLKQIWIEIMAVSREMQSPLKIAYLGPEATYTHMAVLRQFGSAGEVMPIKSIYDVFQTVETGNANFGVVPIENSTGGAVNHTLDRFLDSSLKIVAEIYLNVSHCLLSGAEDISSIKKIYSHAQSIVQCRSWIQNNLPNAEINETSSNAKAASVASWDKFGAAIAGRVAADVYDLNVLAEGIQDNSINITRFLVIGDETSKKTGDDKTSLVCSVQDKAGALQELLSTFSKRGINMNKIESRPSRTKAWEYLFYIDIDGHIDDDNVKATLEDLEAVTKFVKILGSYPKGRLVKG